MQVPVLEYRFLLLETAKLRILQSLICICVFLLFSGLRQQHLSTRLRAYTKTSEHCNTTICLLFEMLQIFCQRRQFAEPSHAS